jgi:hypothetical protein
MGYSLLLALQSGGMSWEDVRTVLSAVSVAGIIGTLKLLITMRDDVRETKREVGSEKDGTGLLGRVNKIDSRVKRIEDRNLRLDAVYADYVSDLENHNGPERRTSGKNLRASLRATIEENLSAQAEG